MSETLTIVNERTLKAAVEHNRRGHVLLGQPLSSMGLVRGSVLRCVEPGRDGVDIVLGGVPIRSVHSLEGPDLVFSNEEIQQFLAAVGRAVEDGVCLGEVIE